MRVIILAVAFFAFAEASAAPRARGATAPAQQARSTPHANDGHVSDYLSGPAGQRTSLRDYPGGATFITRKMMNDFQANTICDALRFAPGVTAGGC